jgi:hypothetical protein
VTVRDLLDRRAAGSPDARCLTGPRNRVVLADERSAPPCEVPQAVHVADEVPRTARGKLDRARLPGLR